MTTKHGRDHRFLMTPLDDLNPCGGNGRVLHVVTPSARPRAEETIEKDLPTPYGEEPEIIEPAAPA